MNPKNFISEILCSLSRVMPGLAVLTFTRPATANPVGMTVQNGSATLSVNGSQLTINAGNNAQLNWQSFNIAAGEKTVFNQPSAASIVWNRVNDPNPSQIYGSLQANGVVVLLNSSGFYFGPNSFVSAAGLVVSTASCLPPQNPGGAWEFNGPPPLASIINYGTIKIGNGGSAYLIADKVENRGDVEAPGGSIGFAAGQTVTLSERPDGRGMSMNVTLPQGSVNNYGNLVADAGTVALNAKVVNQNGLIQANSVRDNHGLIELFAADDLSLGANSQILARGDASDGGSAGGKITLQSGNVFSDASGSVLVTAGGAAGGNGGNIEVSAPNITSLNSAMDAHARPGFIGGEFLLDPVNIILGTTGNGTIPANGLTAYNSAPGTLNLNVNTAFANKNFSNIKLQATGSITVNSSTIWNLSSSTGVGAGQLTLQAGGNITMNDGSQILDAGGWAVALAAGYDFIHNLVTPGVGSVVLNGSGSIQTAAGSILLAAGNNITVGSGYVITTGGGGINAHALAGGIDTGSDAQGYTFKLNATTLATAYDLSHGLGGISTAAGGDVDLTAGGNITSVLPGKKGFFYNGNFISAANSDYTTAGAGAYGRQTAGNVNIVAGGNVTGNYLVAKGTGSIFAGVQMDANGNPITDPAGNYLLGTTGSAGTAQLSPNLALNLISGGWNVTAAQNIFLQEVRNPNGIFNVNSAAAMRHLFDYAPGDFVNLTAGNAVQLGGTFSGLPRADALNVPMIFPGILDVNAGAGGVTFVGDSIFNQLILFPSPQGSLVINTTGGGSLTGQLPTSAGAPQIFNLIVSDSGNSQYKNGTTFGMNDHATTPLHSGHVTPMQVNISGDMNLLNLSSPEAAEVNVVGNMNNCRLQAMNLLDTDVTSITVGLAAKLKLELAGILTPATDSGLAVGGNINNRSAFTSVDLSQIPGTAAPILSYLSRSQNGSPTSVQLVNSFFYNPKTDVLTYQNIPGVSLASVLQMLQHLTVQKVDRFGNPVWLDIDQTVPATEVVSVMNAATASALLAKYNSLGAIPSGGLGYAIGGGGKFEVTAANLDLGTTPGIQSKGVGYYRNPNGAYPLASLFTQGADIDINLTGDLTMYSSSIASLNGGNISINAGGGVSVGSSEFSVSATGARGIYTASLGNVSVVAHDNIDVNGSRIAAYDGGNVTVESLNGDINAGTGGFGYVVLTAYYVDPITHQVYTDNPTIPGSGILSTTFPPRNSRYPAPRADVGNILVETPNGSVNASAGGVIQFPLNGGKSPDAICEVLAGYELRDDHGNALSASDISNSNPGTPVRVSDTGNIEANGSGIIGQNVLLKATDRLSGVFFSPNQIIIDAGSVGPTVALAKSISATGPATGPVTLIGTERVDFSGGGDPTILSQNANGGGSTFTPGTAANAAANAASANDDTSKVVQKAENTTENDALDEKRAGKGIVLAKKVGRVTVILPGSATKTPKL